jgi:hypothetical protein
MSRVVFSFGQSRTVPASQAYDERPQPPKEVRNFRDRIWNRQLKVREALTNSALFVFGFGSGSLLAHLAVNYSVLYLARALHSVGL